MTGHPSVEDIRDLTDVVAGQVGRSIRVVRMKHKGVWARAVPRPPSSPRVREKDGCHGVELCEDRERRGSLRPALHGLAPPRWHAVLSDRASGPPRGAPPSPP